MNVMAYAHALVKTMLQRWKRAAACCIAPGAAAIAGFNYRDALRACLRVAHKRATAFSTSAA